MVIARARYVCALCCRNKSDDDDLQSTGAWLGHVSYSALKSDGHAGIITNLTDLCMFLKMLKVDCGSHDGNPSSGSQITLGL